MSVYKVSFEFYVLPDVIFLQFRNWSNILSCLHHWICVFNEGMEEGRNVAKYESFEYLALDVVCIYMYDVCT